MTALETAQSVAVSVGIEVPSTLTSDQNPTARLIRVLMNRGGIILAEKRGPFGESWLPLTRPYTLTTVAGQEYYGLPDGFVSLINGTVWDRETYEQARGPLSPQEWAAVKNGLIGAVTISPRFRVSWDHDNNIQAIRLDPTPASGGEELVFEYISNHWVQPSAASAPSQSQITADTNVPIFPPHLMELDLEWRLRKSRGLQYQGDLGEFELERDRTFSQSLSPPTLSLRPSTIGLGVNIPEGSWGIRG